MKPKVNVKCVASQCEATDERIIEFSHPNGGGLISIRAIENGNLIVEPYRCDATVKVIGCSARFEEKIA